MYFRNPLECLIRFEAWAKLAQQWLVCAPLGIHLEPINKSVNVASNNITIINCAAVPKRELCSGNKKLFGPINCAAMPKRELCSGKKEALWTNGVPARVSHRSFFHGEILWVWGVWSMPPRNI